VIKQLIWNIFIRVAVLALFVLFVLAFMKLTYVPILDVIEVAPFFEERSCQ